MILLADSGASKTDWALVERGAGMVASYNTMGYNPNYLSVDGICEDIRKSLPVSELADKVDEIHFYGSGVSKAYEYEMCRILRELFPRAVKVEALSDTLGACRALLGDGSGFVAILGTGMNTCIYDGKGIADHVGSLGYVLGDEGSGAHIGKLLLVDYLRHGMPEEAWRIVHDTTGLDESDVIRHIYKEPYPNRFCASMTRLVADNLGTSPYFEELVRRSFSLFFSEVVAKYPDVSGLSFNCVGSVGYHFRDILVELAKTYGLKEGKVISAPIFGLVEYHR